MHADADAALLHRLDVIQARDPQLLQRQERREDVPAVAVIAALGQAQRRLLAPQLEVARHERAAPRVELLQAP